MRSVRTMSVLSGLVAAATLAAGHGCSTIGDDCEGGVCANPPAAGGSATTTSTTSTTSSGGGGGSGGQGQGGSVPPGCIPSGLGAGEAPADECGVFVSASVGSDEEGDGTKAAPYASFAKAMSEGATRVYACGESFDEAAELTAGTTVYGALACSNGWSYDDATRTTIAPTAATLDAAGTSIALRLATGAGTTRLLDVNVTAPDANEASESSIALLANAVTVELERCDLTAGVPMAGEAGTSLVADAGLDGVAGDPGNAALGPNTCNTTGNPGGAGGTKSCGGVAVDGGNGGGAFTSPGGDGQEGDQATVDSTGDGGVGAPQNAGSCETGHQGANGPAGAAGVGAMGFGELTASGHSAAPADAGGAGQHAQGGGGGGASACTTGATGPSGGGGGSGGCGGAGGGAGESGGSSIALVSLNATVTLTECALVTAGGAVGGAGGDGQPGGYGQPGANGGGNGSCGGGQGGNGGKGGAGGGGAGGHSIALAFVTTEGGAAPVLDSATTLSTQSGGAGGQGGEGDEDLAGADGMGCDVLDFGGAGTDCTEL